MTTKRNFDHITENNPPTKQESREIDRQERQRNRKFAVARKAQTRREQAKGRKAVTGVVTSAKTQVEQKKGRNAAKVRARKYEKALKDYHAKENRLKSVKELEKEDAERENWRAAFDPNVTREPIPTDHWRERPNLLAWGGDDPNVVLPKAVQAVVDVANAHYEPHVRLTWEFEVFGLPPTISDRLTLICDGVSEVVKIILAQHGLSALGGRVTYSNAAIQPKQKEFTNGE